MIPFLNETSRQLQPHVFAAVAQGAVFAALIGAIDLALGRRIRAGLRHALWMLVILKFLLPPTLTLPTSAAYWISHWSQGRFVVPPMQTPVLMESAVPIANRVVRMPVTPIASGSPNPTPTLSGCALLGLTWIGGSVVLVGLILRRHREIRRLIGESVEPTKTLKEALAAAGREVGLRNLPTLRLTLENHSPAICGSGSPTLLLPQFLAERASSSALRGILLHELVHLRRHDLWFNAVQLLTQALWWWNPVVWLSNARIRALREFTVDQEVQHLHGSNDPMAYPTALVEVARQCLTRPQLALGFVGIFESGRSIEHRVRKLIENPVPTRIRLGASGWAALCGISLVAIPMGFAKPPTVVTMRDPGVVEMQILDGGEAVRLNREWVPIVALQSRLTEVVHKDPGVALHITGKGNPSRVLNIAKAAGIVRMSLALRPSLRERLESIQLEGLRMESVPLSKAVAMLLTACESANPNVLLFNDQMLRGDPKSKPVGESIVQWRQPNGKLNAREVLDEMTRHANQPLEYLLIEDYVVFRCRSSSQAAELHTRQFRLNAVNDADYLLGMVGLPTSSSPEELNKQLRVFLRTVGVDFGAPEDGRPFWQQTTDTSPHIFYSWQKQLLFARGTLPDLDVLEFVLQYGRVRQPQVDFEVLLLDADDETLDWVRSAQKQAIRRGSTPTSDTKINASPGRMNVHLGSEETHLFTLDSKAASQLSEKMQKRWNRIIRRKILTTLDLPASVSASPTDGYIVGVVQAELTASSLPGKGRFRLKAACTEEIPSKNSQVVSLQINADFELQDEQTAVIACDSVRTKDGEISPRRFILLVTPTLVDEVGQPLNRR